MGIKTVDKMGIDKMGSYIRALENRKSKIRILDQF